MQYTIKKIEFKLFRGSMKGKGTIKYKIERTRIGKLKGDYREDTRYLNNIVKVLESKGYGVFVDNNDLTYYHVLYVSY
ncbi:hypothetical protein RYE12_16965 [Clostridioides difficile]|nr:hypothetical protein [Clostridioides difficile]